MDKTYLLFENESNTSLNIKRLKIAHELIKLISFLILMILFVISSVGILGQYFDRTTSMKTNVVSQNNALFPAMTFCPVTAGYKNEIFRVSRQISVQHYSISYVDTHSR